MPREEDLPPSKRQLVTLEAAKENERFLGFMGKTNRWFFWNKRKQLINYINKSNAINNLLIEKMIERIDNFESILKK